MQLPRIVVAFLKLVPFVDFTDAGDCILPNMSGTPERTRSCAKRTVEFLYLGSSSAPSVSHPRPIFASFQHFDLETAISLELPLGNVGKGFAPAMERFVTDTALTFGTVTSEPYKRVASPLIWRHFDLSG